jgi:hypothetical protein
MDLFNQYKNFITLSAIGILLTLLAIQSYRINSYKADLAECTSQQIILSSSIQSQNDSINKLSEDGIKRSQDSLIELNKVKQANGIKLNKINSLNAQIGKLKSCDSASEYSKGIL